MLIVGKSQSGKTTKGVEVVKHMLSYVHNVVVVAPTFEMQHTWDDVRKHVTNNFITGDGMYEKIRGDLEEEGYPPSLLVIDDVSAEKSLNQGTKGGLNWLIYNAVWINLSIIVIAHKLSSVSSGLKENLEHVLFFTTTRPKEVKAIAEEFNITGDVKSMRLLYEHAVSSPMRSGDPHSFLYVDMGSPPRYFRKFEALINLKGSEEIENFPALDTNNV
jgi:hypothetical protein